jgi:hypothetical protein
MKNKEAKSVERIKVVSEELSYDPGDPVGDVATGLLCVGYLLESLSEAGNESVDGMTCWGLAQALQHYAHDARKYLKPIAEPCEVSLPMSLPVRK